MKYDNITPTDYVERDNCLEIYNYLERHLPDADILVLVRAWMQDPIYPNQKYVSIVTSAEGHLYTPPEKDDPNCLGVFMHYYPKPSVADQFDPDKFLELENVYPLQLGETKFFKGNHLKPILKREIDVSFIGQLDPYRRMDFYEEIVRCANHIDNTVFHFYEGWNNGIGERYSEVMSNSKIALVPCGSASLDTFRFYEAAKCGCIILSCPQNRYDFMEHGPQIQAQNWIGLKDGIDLLFKNTRFFEKISTITREFWETNLSPAAAANTIYNKIKGKL